MNDYTIKMQIKLDKADTQVLEDSVRKGTGTGLKDGMKDAWGGLKNMIKNDVINLVDTIGQSFKNLIRDSINELSSMLEYSQLSNAHTRDLAFGYGLNASQAYGYDKAMSMLGFQSEEDLFYANQQELKQFREAFNKYTAKYEKLYDEGFFETLQEYQFEMEDFKQEMQMTVMEFFMDNKETLKSALKAILTIADWVVKGFGWLIGSSESAQKADIVSQYNVTNGGNTNANLNVNNTFNNVDSSTSNMLARDLSAEYRNIIKAIGGGN